MRWLLVTDKTLSFANDNDESWEMIKQKDWSGMLVSSKIHVFERNAGLAESEGKHKRRKAHNKGSRQIQTEREKTFAAATVFQFFKRFSSLWVSRRDCLSLTLFAVGSLLALKSVSRWIFVLMVNCFCSVFHFHNCAALSRFTNIPLISFPFSLFSFFRLFFAFLILFSRNRKRWQHRITPLNI